LKDEASKVGAVRGFRRLVYLGLPQHHKQVPVLFTWLFDGLHKLQAAHSLCVDKTPVDDSKYEDVTFKFGITRFHDVAHTTQTWDGLDTEMQRLDNTVNTDYYTTTLASERKWL
jgi:hypothetical protein